MLRSAAGATVGVEEEDIAVVGRLSGNIKVTIWENTTEMGPFFSTTLSCPFKDQSLVWRKWDLVRSQ